MKILAPLATLFTVVLLYSCSEPKPPTSGSYPISSIDIKNVILTDSFWLPKVKLIQDTTIHHAFEKCAEEGRMDNFLVAGKVKPGKTRGAMPFDDTDLYKTIEGASYSLISMPNPELEVYLDSIISIIKVGQEPDGYLTTWFTIDQSAPPANWVKPSKERWENEITSHELYNSGHLFEAAAAHYWATGKKNLLDIALKNADLLVANFSPDKLHVPPGHQIVETGLIKLYDITHKKDYLALSKYFIDLRGDSTAHKLYGTYYQDHLPVTQQAEAVGHAVRAEYLYAGMTDIAARFNDPSYSSALDNLWDNVVNKKTYLTGGVGALHDGEAFGKNYELPNLTAYAETCASIGSVWWNQKMFQLSGDAKYYDVLERTLYNGLISGISTDGKKFFYTNPLESDGKFMFNRGACTRQSWFDCSCCPTNMIRFLPSLAGLIYATKHDTVYTNLFISSEATLKTGDTGMKIVQKTGYPWNGDVIIKLEPEKKTKFTLQVRVPGWLRNEVMPGNLYNYRDAGTTTLSLMINGKEERAGVNNGYLSLTREWSKDDEVRISFPMEVRKVVTSNDVAGNANKVAFEKGPIVYCAEEVDNKNFRQLKVSDDIALTSKRENLLGQPVDVLVAKDIKLIPYYLWSNRGVNGMKVWIDEAGK
ncbi:MAG TPA: beta-L-arabinofuranosidase domain-containing protein [Cyclobacteriaceae bacterium]|nr:beta-L-arabinofuranosidase domain-containing protein [Cyclobacteriaceae bacterium]